MTDTTITDAEAFPMDDGTGVSDGDENYNSAAWYSLLARFKGDDSYVGEDTAGNATLQFNDVDTTNEEVDVGTGYAYITESSHSIQSRPQTTYDTTVPLGVPYVVLLPTEVTNLGLGTDNVNDLWLAVDPTAASDPVYIRHGNGLSAPSDPNVKLGTVNTSSGATTRASDLADATFNTISAASGTGGSTQLDTGTVTASGGSTPAVDTTLANVGLSEDTDFWALVYTDADPGFNADYAYNWDYGQAWDDTNQEVDINLTVNWDTDPGAGNDVTLRWELRQP